MAGKYDDIIHLPHPDSPTHARMPIVDRAAQFSAFAALTGYEAAVQETARHVDSRIELDEDVKAELDDTLRYILAQPAPGPKISVTYFVPDERKSGGSYETVAGYMRKLDRNRRQLLLTGNHTIPLEDIADIRCMQEENSEI